MTIAPELLRQPLSVALREGSKAEHEAAENSGFVTELLDGRINETGYADYLRRLLAIYTALEAAVFAHRHDRLVAAVYDPALQRRAALESDLAHWAPGQPVGTDSPAAAAYAARLRDADWGGALLAHHYTRYLGDLSGGRIIGKNLNRTYHLHGAGLACYDFPAIAKPKLYKDAYRRRLDALELSDADTARIVDEVKVAFGLNQAIFAELGANLAAYAR
ncbi:MAG: biliverdin-producing heme oxygenase [Mycobacterium sp.]|nr:biliverdin-producing heme oxygenase [Mycobacterium sp.]